MSAMISRTIKEGFHGVGRHMAMSISAAIAVTVTLIIIALFLVFSFNVQNFTRNIEQSLDIYAGVAYDYENREDELRQEIEAIEGVASITFYTKDEEFETYINGFTDEATREAFEPFREDNPMHDAFYVETKNGSDIEKVAEELNKIDGLVDVSYGGQSTVNLVDALASIRRIGAVLVAVMSLLAIFLIQNTIKLTIYARQDEITIMRNVGAKNSFIRSPFVMEGMIIGALGSIIPIVLTVYGYYYLYRVTGGTLISRMFNLLAPNPFIFYLSGGLLLIGILVGLVGSYYSVTRYLRVKR